MPESENNTRKSMADTVIIAVIVQEDLASLVVGYEYDSFDFNNNTEGSPCFRS